MRKITGFIRPMIFVVAAIALIFAAISLHAEIYGLLQRAKTVAQAARIMKYIEGCNVSKTRSSSVYYTEGDAEYAKIAEDMINTYLPLLCADFELEASPHITLIIYPRASEMYGSIGYKLREGGPAPMGAYSAGILTVLSPTYWAKQKDGKTEIDEFISNGPVVHEMAHLMLDKKTNGNYKEWFSEGVALFYENKYTGYEPAASREAAENSRASYRELSEGFKYLDETESYRKSYEIIRFIDSLEGEEKLKRIFTRLERGASLDSALKKELGQNYFALDNL